MRPQRSSACAAHSCHGRSRESAMRACGNNISSCGSASKHSGESGSANAGDRRSHTVLAAEAGK